MKRLLFILSMVALLTLMLALSIGATAIPEFGDVVHIDIDEGTEGVQEINISNHLQTVVTEGENTSADARVILTCTCSEGRHTYPTYYITKKDGGNYLWFNWSDINSYNPCKATYSSANILAIEIPNGITVMTNCLKGNKTIQFLDMSTAETMTCVETGTGYNAVSNCTSLIEARIPASMTEIRGWCFFGCSALERFIIPTDSNLTFIGAYSFSDCTSLTAFYLPSKLEKIGNNSGSGQGVFNSCTNLYLVNEPVTPTNTPQKPNVYYFPSTLKTIYGEEFKNCKSLNETFVFPEGFTAVSNRWVFNGSPFVNAVFLGDMTEVGAQYWGCQAIYFANKNDLQRSDIATFTNPTNASVNYCNAEGNEAHLYLVTVKTEATCVENGVDGTVCFCGAANPNGTSVIPAKGHSKDSKLKAISYESFFKNGNKIYSCPDCESDYISEDEGAKIFTWIGYSRNEIVGSYAILNSFGINRKALDEYNKYAENKISEFGVVGSTANNTPNGSPLDASKNVMVNYTNKSYDIVEIKIGGLDNYQSTELYLTAYIKVGGKNLYAEDGELVEALTKAVKYA